MSYPIFNKRLVTNGLKWQFQNVQEGHPHFLDTDVGANPILGKNEKIGVER